MTSHFWENVAWRFGGPLSSLPPGAAASLLLALGLAGCAWAILSYRRTLVDLSIRKRNTLLVLRLGLLTLLLLLLAGPSLVDRPDRQPDDPSALRPLAVVLDRSDSMMRPDNRRQRRLDDARRRWLASSSFAQKKFSHIETFAFASELTALADPDAQPPLGGDKTRLFSSLGEILSAPPPGGWGGIVTLTDGLDTSGDSSDEAASQLARDAIRSGTPLYFVPGRNRYAGGNFLLLRDWNAPGRLAPRSSHRLEVTIDSYQTGDITIPIRLRVGEKWMPAEQLKISAGRRLTLWNADIVSADAGTLPIEVRLGEDAGAVVAHADIEVQASSTTNILYYQGALDWGYKFLADVLRRDPSFHITPIFRLAPARAQNDGQVSVVGPPLPATRAGYKDCDVVVLANASASQLSSDQQKALTDWVRDGGVLVFLAPDDSSTQGFAGSEIEKMLPVVFASTAPPETVFYARRGSSQNDPVVEFSWEPAAQKIFGQNEILSPRFVNYARVFRAKPGAEILARHPTALSPAGGDPGRAILLAVQRYGQGQSAVLTSDALWRWKLNQPSSERNVEKFWQNLFAWLGRGHTDSLRFDRTPLTVQNGQEILIHLVGPDAPLSSLSASQGATSAAVSTAEPSGNPKAKSFRWKPSAPGQWQLTATEPSGQVIRHSLTVTGSDAFGENSSAPPDEALLARLAAQTGGALITDGPPDAWVHPASLENTPPSAPETSRPLWHHGWLLGAVLACYCVELLLRRLWRLV